MGGSVVRVDAIHRHNKDEQRICEYLRREEKKRREGEGREGERERGRERGGRRGREGEGGRGERGLACDGGCKHGGKWKCCA